MSTYEPNIDEWIYLIKGNHIEHCKEQELLLDNNVIPVLERPDVFVDADRIARGLSLQKYFPFELLPWEKFQFALIAGCFLQKPGEPDDIYFHVIWDMLGRGSGKNGFIDFLAFYFISPLHGVPGYNVDLIANGEDEAATSIKDVYGFLDNPVNPKYARALASNYRWTLEKITGKAMQAEFRLNTTSKKNKDSKRSGCIIYDEKHEYVDTDNMDTLKSGLGKMKWWREITITTDGRVRGGVLDREKEQAAEILRQYDPHNRRLINWFRIEDESEWNQIDKIVKAVPSLASPTFAPLRQTIEQEIADMPTTPDYYITYLAKRCNFVKSDPQKAVADWADIVACCDAAPFEIHDGMKCVGGLDFMKTNDFCGCILLFREGEEYAIKHHSFICRRSADLPNIKAPIQAWCDEGVCEVVDDVEIPPSLPAEWFRQNREHYDIQMIGIDTYRWTLLAKAFKGAGFTPMAKEGRNIWLVRPSDIEKVAALVIRLFITRQLHGFDRMMCWYTNNTKRVDQKNGNIRFEKIEPKLRKTDGFMGLVHAFCCIDFLPEEDALPDLPMAVFSY